MIRRKLPHFFYRGYFAIFITFAVGRHSGRHRGNGLSVCIRAISVPQNEESSYECPRFTHSGAQGSWRAKDQTHAEFGENLSPFYSEILFRLVRFVWKGFLNNAQGHTLEKEATSKISQTMVIGSGRLILVSKCPPDTLGILKLINLPFSIPFLFI